VIGRKPQGDLRGFAKGVELECLYGSMTVDYGGRVNWKWEEGDLHLYKISRASADALAHTSGVVDDAPEAFWSLNAFPRPEKKILVIS
jgi:hypothetical protein